MIYRSSTEFFGTNMIKIEQNFFLFFIFFILGMRETQIKSKANTKSKKKVTKRLFSSLYCK